MVHFSCAALLAYAIFAVSDAFVSPQARWVPSSIISRQQGQRSFGALTPISSQTNRAARKATASDDDVTSPATSSPPEDLDYYDGLLGEQPGATKAVKSMEGEDAPTNDYPIPLPSYLLLALATVLSIACIGSVFEVIGGHPELGFPATYVIGTLSLPSFIFLFYAAIKKGKAEVEEDDAKYGRGRW